MGTPYFNRDESIILTAHKVKFDSALSDVMLTSERIILIDAGYAQFKPQIIPLATIETVIPGEDAYGNPIITLSLAATTRGGATQSKELVFSLQAGGERKQECNDWVRHIKEQIRSIREKASVALQTPPEQDTDIIFDDAIGTFTNDTPTSLVPPETGSAVQDPGMTTPPERAGAAGSQVSEGQPAAGSGAVEGTETSKTSLSSRFHPAPASQDNLSYSSIAAIIIVILAVVGIAVMYSGILQVTPQASPVPTTLPITPASTTAVPAPTTIVPTLTASPVITAVPTAPPQITIPDTGVWVRVQYTGNFTGQIDLSGGIREVMGTGDRFYRIPTVDGMVAATIQKQDGSGNVLTVDVYKNGTLVKSGTVASPKGIVDLHVDLKMA